MTETVEVPGPEPGWREALRPLHPNDDGEPNPARQYFTFEEAMGRYREIAALEVDITDIARRLRLMLEPGHSAQLGPVDAAFFAIRRTGFAVYRYGSEQLTVLGLFHHEKIGPVEAVDILLEALGVDWRAVASVDLGDGRDPLFVEPVLDDARRPTFPEVPITAKQRGSGT